MTTIRVFATPPWNTFARAKAGEEFVLEPDGLRWPLELRQKPPRVRVLEDGNGRDPVLCELLDPWPNAPAYYPPEWTPGAGPAPSGNFYEQCPIPGRQS